MGRGERGFQEQEAGARPLSEGKSQEEPSTFWKCVERGCGGEGREGALCQRNLLIKGMTLGEKQVRKSQPPCR